MAGELELETIHKCEDALKLGLVRGILEDAGIPYLLKGRFGPASSIRAFPALTGDMPFEVQVAKDCAEEARALVAQLQEEE
jgi:hypothetical protein